MFKKKIKKILLTTALISIGALGLTGCSSKETGLVDTESKPEEAFKVTLVLSKGGVNDKSFNQSAYEGALEAKQEHKIEVSYLESQQDADYISNIETAIDKGSDLVIGVGYELTDAIESFASLYPEQKFAIVDGVFENEIPKNVVPILFNEEESGYSAGLIAGKMTETKEVAFVGGIDIPSVSNFAIGFEKALKEVDPKINFYKQYANSFTDSAKGKAIANQFYNQGVDIIFTAGGGVNSGVFESATEYGKKAIGVDMPSSHLAPNVVLTSALKKVNVGVKETIIDSANDNFKGGESKLFDLSNDGVGFEATDLIPQDVLDFANKKIASLKK